MLLASCASEEGREEISAYSSQIRRGFDDASDLVSDAVVYVSRVDGAACTGSLITPSLVLTSAHCVDSIFLGDNGTPNDVCDDPLRRTTAADLTVEIGRTRNAPTNPTYSVLDFGERVSIYPACMHQYSGKYYDVALLALAADVPPSVATPQFPLMDPVLGIGWQWAPVEARLHLGYSGYGRIDDGTTPLERQYQKFDTPQFLDNYGNGTLPISGMLYYREGGFLGTRSGDSGGPLFVAPNPQESARFPRFQIGVTNSGPSDDTASPSAWVELGFNSVATWLSDRARSFETAYGDARPGRWFGERDYVGTSAWHAPYDLDGDQYYDWVGPCPTRLFEAAPHFGGVDGPPLPDLNTIRPALYAEQELFINDRVHVFSASGAPVSVVAGNENRRLQDASLGPWYGMGTTPPAAEPGLRFQQRHTYARIGADADIDGTVVVAGGFLTSGPRATFDELWGQDTDVHPGSLPYIQTIPVYTGPQWVPRLRMSHPVSPVIAYASNYKTGGTAEQELYGVSKYHWQSALPPGVADTFDMIKVDNREYLHLSPGVYRANWLQVEPEGTLVLTCDAGVLAATGRCPNTTVLIAQGVDFKGHILVHVTSESNRHPPTWNLGAPPAAESFLLGYFGASEAFVHFLDMTVVAPHAKVTVFSGQYPNRERAHRGAIYARGLEVHQDSQFEFVQYVCSP